MAAKKKSSAKRKTQAKKKAPARKKTAARVKNSSQGRPAAGNSSRASRKNNTRKPLPESLESQVEAILDSGEPIELNYRQRRFCLLFIASKDLNATRAYIDAGYSPNGAEQSASELLRNPKVAAFIEREMRARENRIRHEADAILLELARVGFSNIRDYVDFGPGFVTMKHMDAIPEDAIRAIQAVEVRSTEYGKNVKFKLHDKVKSLELLGRHRSLFVDVQAKAADVAIVSPETASSGEEWAKKYAPQGGDK